MTRTARKIRRTGVTKSTTVEDVDAVLERRNQRMIAAAGLGPDAMSDEELTATLAALGVFPRRVNDLDQGTAVSSDDLPPEVQKVVERCADRFKNDCTAVAELCWKGRK